MRTSPRTSNFSTADGLSSAGGTEPPKRDLKKVFLVVGLGALSWVATYVGMLELIEANMGDLPILHKAIIGFSVAMLMTMIIWLLDQMFQPIGFLTKLSYVAGYVFLTIISVGFGFGFYWKVLESRSEQSRSAESAVSQVQGSLNAASTRLEQLNATLLQLATVSREKAEIERTKGTSCPNSKPGDGPRRKMRDDDASRFSFASDFVKGRVDAVKGEMGALNGDLAKIASADASTFDAKTGTRNEFMKSLSRKLDMTVTGFNAFRTDPQLKQLRNDLDERAGRSTFGDPKSGGFVCPDAQLQQALKGAVRAIDQLPELQKPVIAAVEGSEATIEAFRRLTTTFYGLLSFKLPPSADELRELQQKAMQSVEASPEARNALAGETAAGLSKRDYVPLAVAIFVDICLLLVSIGRPLNRLNSLVPKMREAEQGPIIEILSRFKDIHKDREVRESFELFRHVVFDLNGDYYVAVPLDAPPRMNPQQREQLRLEAQLLSNLFASFEKERIFTRTWTPFTKKIQSKLRKQGSKFAEAEAFRVYRFRKGAWSEIILGAVMGAARRAEEERRRRADAAGLTGVATPELPMGAPRQDPVLPPHLDPALAATRASRPRPEHTRSDTVLPFPGPVREAAAAVSALNLGAAQNNNTAPVSAHRPAAPIDPAVAAAFGNYAEHAKAELEARPQPTIAVAAANSNSAISQRAAQPAHSVVVPAAVALPAAAQPVTQPQTASVAVVHHSSAAEPSSAPPPTPEATIGVVLKRETVTIPVSESALARSLPSLLARAASTAQPAIRLQTVAEQPAGTAASDNTAAVAAAIGSALTVTGETAAAIPPFPVVESPEAAAFYEDIDETPLHHDEWTEVDVTMVRRFRPEAAE